MSSALGLVEIKSFSASLAAIDAAQKSGHIQLRQIELNDLYGVCVKFTGSPADVRAAISAAEEVARQMRVDVVSDQINAPDARALAAWNAKIEFNPLVEQNVVSNPDPQILKEYTVSDTAPFAIGMIETQGLTAVIEAIDTACKSANVEILGREKLGGGYITVILKGDVAAVKAAVESGKAKVEGLGKLIAAHVIPRPSASVLALLPKVS
jgi:microcompartment protein CcmL/EutN